MPLSSLDAGLTTMRQGVYESYVGSNEVKLQFVNTFLYGSHSFCFPLCPSSSSTVYDSLNVRIRYPIICQYGFGKSKIYKQQLRL